jgi:hypothetical protein
MKNKIHTNLAGQYLGLFTPRVLTQKGRKDLVFALRFNA